MSQAAATLELPLPRDRALQACRAAVARIDWEVVKGAADLSGRQDPARLCCPSAPVTVDLELIDAGEDRTAIAMRGRVLGFGPVARRDLRNAMWRLASAIGRTSEQMAS